MNTPHIIDAKNKILGRVATEAAHILRGKHDPSFMPHHVPLYKVAIVNVAHIRVTGNKTVSKIYKRYSGYPSGLKKISFELQLQKDPKRIIEHAVRNMLPKNKLRALMMKNLTIRVNE